MFFQIDEPSAAASAQIDGGQRAATIVIEGGDRLFHRMAQKPMPAPIPEMPRLHLAENLKTCRIVFVILVRDRRFGDEHATSAEHKAIVYVRIDAHRIP